MILSKVDNNGIEWVYPECDSCGCSVKTLAEDYEEGIKILCVDCKKVISASHSIITDDNSDESKKQSRRLENAIKRIHKQYPKIKEYEQAISIIKKHIHHKHWWQSTEEVMAGLELMRNRIKINHQVAIAGYVADFVLRDMKVVLEIDGKPFHNESYEKMQKQVFRDEVISYAMGEGWEVVRIPASEINVNVRKLVPAIRIIVRKRQRK